MAKVQGGAATIYCTKDGGHRGPHFNDCFIEDPECRVEILKQVKVNKNGEMRWPKTKKAQSEKRT